MTFEKFITKLNNLCKSILEKPLLTAGISAVGLLGLSFFIIYFVRVVYQPTWISQISGTLVLFGIFAAIAAVAFLAKKFSKSNSALLMTLLIFITGTIFAFVTPPNQVPDEPSHYMRSYAMAMGDFHFDEKQEWPNDVHLLMEAFPVAYRNGYPAVKGQSILDRFEIYFDSIESGKIGEPTGIIIFQIIPYLPQALGIFIGRLFGADALVCYWLARIVNLMFYCGCCYFALSWAKRFSMILYAIMAMPLTVFLAASCNNDSMLFGLFFLIVGIALSDTFDRKKAIAFAIAFAVAVTSKANYIVFALLLFLICDKDKWKLKIKRWQYLIITFATLFVVYQGMGMLVGLLSNYGPIERPMSDSNPGAQLMFILSNPLRYFVVFMDTLRNNSFFLSTGGLFGWIDVDIKLVSFVTPMIWLWASVKNAPLFKKSDLKAVCVLFVSALLTYGVVLTGMYLSWTPVTLPQIIGLQMRYVIPAFFGLMFAVAYRSKGLMKEPCENYLEKNEKIIIWSGFVFALVAVALLFAGYYFTQTAIVFVS